MLKYNINEVVKQSNSNWSDIDKNYQKKEKISLKTKHNKKKNIQRKLSSLLK